MSYNNNAARKIDYDHKSSEPNLRLVHDESSQTKPTLKKRWVIPTAVLSLGAATFIIYTGTESLVNTYWSFIGFVNYLLF